MLEPGEVLFTAGKLESQVFVVIEGTVETSVNGNRVSLLEPGDVFGLTALFDKGYRYATARAVTSARVMPVDIKHFIQRANTDPTFSLRVLSQSIRRMQKAGRHIGEMEERDHGKDND